MANNNNDLTVNIKATFDKSNMGDFKSEVTKAVEDAAKSVKAIEIKANTQPARASLRKLTSHLADLSNAKDGYTTLKIHANTKDAEKSIEDLQSKLKDLKVSFDTSKLGNQLNVALRDLNKDDSLKKVKLGTDTSTLLKDINKAITSINNEDSLKKLKLGVDVNYLQQQLNKAVRGLDTTVKLKTKLETTSRTSETKGTVTTNKTSKEEAQQYQSLFSKRAASIANLDRAYQEFGRNSKEVSAAIREFAAASKDVRKFGRDTGVLSLNKVKSDIERQLGAGLTTDFTKNWLRMEYDKVLKDIDTLNRQLKPEKYEKAEDDARVKAYNQEYKIRQAIAAAQIKADKDAERAYKERERVLNEELKIRLALGKKGLSGGLSVDEVKNIKEANQATTALSSQFARLRAEALKAGNALNQATNPKDAERFRANFEKAIQALVNYQRASRGLTKKGEGQLVEKLAIGNIKEGTKAYQVLEEWIKKCEQAQKNLNQTVGRSKLANDVKNNTLLGWLQNMDMGRALSGMAYAARGELNTVQSFGNLLSSLSNVSGVIGTFAKGLGALGITVMAFTGMLNLAMSALNGLINTLTQVGQAVYNALRPGIELYKLRETAQLSFAATLSNMAVEEGKPISYERGLEMSADLVNRAFMDALKSAFNPEELIRAMQGTLGIAFARGLNLDQAYNVVKSTAAVAKSIQLQPNQLLQEVRDILQGTLTAKSSQVAYAVGMTPESLREAQSVGSRIGLTDEGIQQAEEQGRLYDYIMEKMQTYNIALEKYADTFSGAMDRLTEAWALAGMKIFEKIAPGLNGVIDNIINDFILTVDENNMPQISDNLKEVGKALDEIIFKIMADADALIDLIKDVTGEEDTIGAIKVLILDAIDLTVWGLGILVVVVDGLKDVTIKAYNGFTYLKNAAGLAIDFIYNLSAALFDLTTFDFKSIGKRLDDLDKKYGKRSLGDILSEGVIDETQMRGGLGFGHRGKFYQAYGEGHAMYDNKKPYKPTDPTKVTPKDTQENKQNLADLKKAMQEAIEKIKQELKEALAKLKDIAEQNELAYRQGYKSIEDYFSQKAQLEYEEALLKVAALQREIEEVQKLDTGGDAGAQYQKERDLVRLTGDLNIEQRNLNKKAEQTNELLGAIAHNTAIKSYQQGLGYNNASFSRANVSSAISAYGNEVSSILTNSLNNQDMINFESAMQHGTEGCVEFADRFLAQFDNFFKEMLDSGVFDTDVLIEHAREAGMQIQDATEEAIRAVQAGDIIFADTGTGFKNGHTLVVLSNNNGAIQVAANASSTYDNANGSYMLNSGEEHIRTYDLDSYLGDSYSASTIIKSGEKIAQSLNLMENASEQFAQDVRESTNRVEQIRQDIDNSYQDIQARMPRAYSPRVEEYYKAVQDGQTRWLEALSKYNSMMNDNASMLIAVEASVAATAVKLKREAQIFGTQFANQFPELKETLEKMIPIEVLKIEAKIWEQKANERLQMIEDDAKAVNKKLREKSWLFPQAIEQYMSYFQKIGIKDGAYTITDQLQQMAKVADELAKQGVISEARNISKKIIELRSKFSNMIQSWIDEMGNYFNYRKELVNADSGLTSFVKEERVKQLEKGEARVKAVAYGQEAMEWAKLEVKYQEQLNKVLANKNEELDKTMSADADILRMNIADLEIAKQRAMRQAEINAKLGEQKTLWQETMDAANQALENGLYNFMTDYINTAESIGEAFRNMAIDILKDLQKFFAKKAITDLMHVIVGEPNEQYNAPNYAETQIAANTQSMIGWLQAIYHAIGSLQASQSTSVFTNLGGSVVEGVYIPNGKPSAVPSAGKGRATGGYISGPGTSTSDSIPAMLSNGEYVIKADAVKRYGLNFLDAVNSGHFTRMRTIIPRFADGGYVGDALQDTARGMTDFAKNLGTSVGVDNTISIALVRDEQEAIREWAKSPSGGQKFLVDFAKGNGRVFSRFNS